MNSVEQIAALCSDDWGQYQKFITFMKEENRKRLINIVRAWVGMQQSLVGKFSEPGWQFDVAKVKFNGNEDLGYSDIVVIAMRKLGFEVDWQSYDYNYPPDDDTIGFGSHHHPPKNQVPEAYRRYEYARETLIIPNEFIEEHKL